jgi:hypothetical protein
MVRTTGSGVTIQTDTFAAAKKTEEEHAARLAAEAKAHQEGKLHKSPTLSCISKTSWRNQGRVRNLELPSFILTSGNSRSRNGTDARCQ